MQQQAASASVTDSDTQRQQSENINLPGRNTCKGGFLLRTFGAIYNGDTRLHNSHYSNNQQVLYPEHCQPSVNKELSYLRSYCQ